MGKDYYTQKAQEHYAAWEKAQDSGDEKLAKHHMTEYLNYQSAVDNLSKQQTSK